MNMARCKKCKCIFEPKYFLQPFCMETTECIKAHTDYAKLQMEKGWRKRKTAIKNDLKTHSDWCKELQAEVNTIVRLIDLDSICISSLKPLNEKYDAGHRFSVGAFPELRFNLLNIHAQSVNQNQYLSGNPDGYDHGLESIYGKEYLELVHGLKEKYKSMKWSIPELVQAKARAKRIINGLKALNQKFTPKQRIELRKKYNEILGLYPE